jgi:hypothetical protein
MGSPRLCVVLRLTHRHKSYQMAKIARQLTVLRKTSTVLLLLYSSPCGNAAEKRHVFLTMVIKIPKWTLGISSHANLAPSEMAFPMVCSPTLPHTHGAWSKKKPRDDFVPLSLSFVPGGEFLQLEMNLTSPENNRTCRESHLTSLDT